MPDSYIIFITENDVLGKGQAIYRIQRYFETADGLQPFNDGSFIVYANGAYRGDDEIGKLMHDFSCTDPDDMNYKELAKPAAYLKRDKEGVAKMSSIMEEIKAQGIIRVLRRLGIEDEKIVAELQRELDISANDARKLLPEPS